MLRRRHKIRLGDSQNITVRCEPWRGGFRCFASARLGKISWSASGQASADEVEAFIAAVRQVVATLSGSAVLRPSGVSSFEIRVSVTKVGAIRTDYSASGSGGGQLGTEWRATGTFVGWHQHYLALSGETEIA